MPRSAGTEPMVTRRVAGLFWPHWPLVGLTGLCGLLATVAGLVGPAVLGRATDLISAGLVGKTLAPGETKAEAIARLRLGGSDTLANVVSTIDLVPGRGVDFGALGALLGVGLAVFLAGSVFTWLQGRLVASIVQRVMFDLRERIGEKLSRLPVSYFDRTPRGEILSRVTNDVESLQDAMQMVIGQVISMLLTVAGALAVMLVLSPPLAGLALIAVPVAGVMAAVIGVKAAPRYGEQWATTGRLNSHLEEVYTAHALVRGFRREADVQRAFDAENEVLFDAERRAQAITGMIEPSTRFSTDLTFILVAVFGALRVASGSLTIGTVQAFTHYTAIFSRPLVSLAAIAGMVQSGMASAGRVFALLDTPEQPPDAARPVTLPHVRGRVEFDRVSFSYLPDVPLISDLSLTVAPGSLVAIVGATGAGKTTLGNLLMRFYDVDGGRILLDGVDIDTMSRDGLRSLIGLVPQEPWLFGGTIAENIAYGRPGTTRDEVRAAARAMCVDRFVSGLPHGYDTALDDDSATMSAGEKQLITLARAFLAGAPVLILDEATSSIDSRTDELVQEAMNTLRGNRTSFVIAHRLSTIRRADIILVMDGGRIVERGTHDALLGLDGSYATLYRSSLAASGTARSSDPVLRSS